MHNLNLHTFIFYGVKHLHLIKYTQWCSVKDKIWVVHLHENVFSFLIFNNPCKEQLSHLVTRPTKWHVRPAKTQISLGICPVWSVFTVRLMGSYGPKLSSCRQRRLWSDWAEAQADLSLRWAHMPFCWFCHEAAPFYIIATYVVPVSRAQVTVSAPLHQLVLKPWQHSWQLWPVVSV